MRIVAGSLAKCVHVWGVHHFLSLAASRGHETHFLGPAATIPDIVAAIRARDPDCVALSYRLTPETARHAIAEFIQAITAAGLESRLYAFAGTTPVAEIAREFGFFDAVFDGTSGERAVEDFLSRAHPRPRDGMQAGLAELNLVGRLRARAPYPLLRHHFGRPTVEETIAGIEQIADAGVLDVICIGTDQDAQENFFNPERQNAGQKGAGGVPVRTEEDLRRLYRASRRGNHPLLRAYCGTRDLVPLADVYQRTISLCSAGIPIFWYNTLDGRGPMGLEESIREHQRTIAWHGERDIPVEILDSHQWAMRTAHDVVFVASAYISASLCKHLGVGHYIAQLMFNTPAGASFKMDLAKILAALELVMPLEDDGFSVIRMPRAGLVSFPPDEDEAKGFLACSTMLQMAVQPHMINVVGYSEANRAVTHREVIESCKIVRRVVESALSTPFPDMRADPDVVRRRDHLVREARVLIGAIQELADRSGDEWLSPGNLASAVHTGLLDTPQFRAGGEARGTIVTRMIDGCVEAVDPCGHPIGEEERVRGILASDAGRVVQTASVAGGFRAAAAV